ncbi:MAG: alpha/beta hydrolase [Chitinophagales bacterium]
MHLLILSMVLSAFTPLYPAHLTIQPPDYHYQIISNIEYANIDAQPLQLDLYLPQEVSKVPVLIWLHGGAFTGGDKANAHKYAYMFAQKGIAVASVNYRLAPGAHYPAQIQDVKGAIRFLRANAEKYHLDADHIGVLGTSAGGSLACQVGVRCNEKDLEGTVGGNLNYSSCVQAVIDCFGSFSYENMMKVGFGKSRTTHLENLLGVAAGTPEFKAKIKDMAPEFYLDKSDPPFLILHGDQDHTVPLQNSIDFDKKLRAEGIPSTLIISKGYGHDVRMVTAHFDEVMKFLNQYLK